MGSKQAYIKVEEQIKMDMVVIDGIAQIRDKMSEVLDRCVDVMVKGDRHRAQSARFRRLVEMLMKSNRQWTKEMKLPNGIGKGSDKEGHHNHVSLLKI